MRSRGPRLCQPRCASEPRARGNASPPAVSHRDLRVLGWCGLHVASTARFYSFESTRSVRRPACVARPPRALLPALTRRCSTSSSSAPTSPRHRTGSCGCGWPSLRRGLLPRRAPWQCCSPMTCGSPTAAWSTTSCGPFSGSASCKPSDASAASVPLSQGGTLSPHQLSWPPPSRPTSASCCSTTRGRWQVKAGASSCTCPRRFRPKGSDLL